MTDPQTTDLRNLGLFNMMGRLSPQGWNIKEAEPFRYVVTTPLPISGQGRDAIRGLFRRVDTVEFMEAESDD